MLTFLIDHVLKLQWLKGYRMYAAGASLMFAGLGTLAHTLATAGITGATADPSTAGALKLVVAGVGVIGAAGKADRLAATAMLTAHSQALTAEALHVIATEAHALPPLLPPNVTPLKG